MPNKIAVVHIKGHQRGTSYQVRGNNAADTEAKQVAGNYSMILTMQQVPVNKNLSFESAEKGKLKQMGAKEQDETAVRTAQRGWIHASHVKGPVNPPQWKIVSSSGDTKLVLKR